jgi:signal transduction histidine kinase
MVGIVLSSLHFLVSISIIIFTANIEASIKVCHQQNLIHTFQKTKTNIKELESCSNQKQSITHGFKEKSKSIFILDKELKNKILYFSFPMIHEVKFFDFSKPGMVRTFQYSKIQNQGNEYIKINLLDEDYPKVVALINTKSSTQLPFLTFDSEKEYNQFLKSKLLFDGLWFGILTLTCFLTLVMLVIKKSKEIFYYLLHIASLLFIQSAFSGYFFSYFSFLPEYFLHRVVVISCSFLTIGTVGLIHTNFSQCNKQDVIIKFYKGIIYVGFLHLVLSLISYTQLTIKLTSFLTLLLSISTLLICIYAMFLRKKNSTLFFLSFSLFLFSSLAFTMKDLGFLNLNEIHINYLVKISLLIEILVLGIIITRSLLEENRVLSEAVLNKTISVNAKQLHHDIKSPLTSLEFLYDHIKSKLDEDERSIAKESLIRVSDIVNSLEPTIIKDLNTSFPQILYPLISKICSEKRIEFVEDKNVVIELASELDYGTFINFSPTTFSRVISNLINNSKEAKKDGVPLLISVKLKSSGTNCLIEIKDNGVGIRPVDLKKVLDYGLSIGKPNGNGIGLTTAMAEVVSANGSLDINSSFGNETVITIVLPIVNKPTWFSQKLSIRVKNICIIDDDKSVHKVWDNLLKNKGLKIVHVTSSEEFDIWIKTIKINDYYFLFDLELLGSTKDGLQLINEYNLSHSSTLVTSHYNDKALHSRIRDTKVKVIPKESVNQVPIEIEDL